MIIVSGKIYVQPGKRDAFLASSLEAVKMARQVPACQDFIVAADPIESERVNVYEEWDSETALLSFRDNGPNENLTSVIVKASVYKHDISSSGPA